jgi:hypothetical protein
MNSYETYYEAVDEIYSCLARDLIGPVDEQEVLENLEPLVHTLAEYYGR